MKYHMQVCWRVFWWNVSLTINWRSWLQSKLRFFLWWWVTIIINIMSWGAHCAKITGTAIANTTLFNPRHDNPSLIPYHQFLQPVKMPIILKPGSISSGYCWTVCGQMLIRLPQSEPLAAERNLQIIRDTGPIMFLYLVSVKPIHDLQDRHIWSVVNRCNMISRQFWAN
jgi:hypothetical protein